MCMAQIPRVLAEECVEHAALAVEDASGASLRLRGFRDGAARVVQVALEGLDLAEARRRQQQPSQSLPLAPEEGELVLGPGQLARERLARPRGGLQPTIDLADAAFGQLHLGTQGEVPVALCRPPLLSNPLALAADRVEGRQPAFGVASLGFELLVVLEVRLQRGGVHRTFVEEVVEDELAHLADGLEVERLDDQPVEGLGQRAQPVTQLVAIGAGVGEEPGLRDGAQGMAKIAQRADQVAIGDRGNVCRRAPWHHEMGARHVGIGLRGLHGDSAREVAAGVVIVGELQDHVGRAAAAAESDLARARLVLRAQLVAHVAVEAPAALFIGRLVEARLLLVGDERPLHGVQHRRLAAAIVAEEQAAPPEAEGLVGEVVPVDEADAGEEDHPASSPSSDSSAGPPLGAAATAPV